MIYKNDMKKFNKIFLKIPTSRNAGEFMPGLAKVVFRIF